MWGKISKTTPRALTYFLVKPKLLVPSAAEITKNRSRLASNYFVSIALYTDHCPLTMIRDEEYGECLLTLVVRRDFLQFQRTATNVRNAHRFKQSIHVRNLDWIWNKNLKMMFLMFFFAGQMKHSQQADGCQTAFTAMPEFSFKENEVCDAI